MCVTLNYLTSQRNGAIEMQHHNNNMVPVQNANGAVRTCVDLAHLNKSVQREIHPISSVDESLATLGNSKVFSNSWFWQLPLDDE